MRARKPGSYGRLDFGTPELQKKRAVEIKDKKARVRHATMLEIYESRGYIDQKQFDAGYKLSKLWNIAGKDVKVTFNYNSAGSGMGNAEDANLLRSDAEQKYKQSIASVSYSNRSLMVHVCCQDLPAGRNFMGPLREGLNELVNFYKL